jgi:hypothetical protein
MEEHQYPYNFFDANECFEYVSIQELLEKVNVELERHDNRIAGALTECYQLLTIELEFIVETVLIRHLELWAKSLIEEIHFEVQSNTFTFNNGELYTGPVFCEFQESGIPDKYFVEETEYTELVMYAKEGQIICENVSDEMTGCFSNTWYRMELPYGTIVFNIGCEKPIAFQTGYNNRVHSLNNVIEEILIAFTKDYNGVYPILSKDLFFSK